MSKSKGVDVGRVKHIQDVDHGAAVASTTILPIVAFVVVMARDIVTLVVIIIVPCVVDLITPGNGDDESIFIFETSVMILSSLQLISFLYKSSRLASCFCCSSCTCESVFV